MKKRLFLLLIALFTVNFVANACDIIVELYDSAGGGWETNVLDITYVNESSVTVTDHFTITPSQGDYSSSIISVKDDTEMIIYLNGPGSTNVRKRSFRLKYDNDVLLYVSPELTSGYTHTISQMDCNDAYTSTRKVVLYSNIAEGGSLTGNGTYNIGNNVTITATPNPGYYFNNWTRDGVIVSTSISYTFELEYNCEYTANFVSLEGDFVGNGENSSMFLPGYSYYDYAISQQIYTYSEISGGEINKISLYNDGVSKTRYYVIYLNTTDKVSFENDNDWIDVTEGALVYDDYVTLPYGMWTTIDLTDSFIVGSNMNLCITVFDYSEESEGEELEQLECRVFNGDGNQALYIYSDDELDPENITDAGTLMSVKNQIIIGYSSYNCTINASANNASYGSVSGGGSYPGGTTCTLTAVPNLGYEFKCWKEGGIIVSTDAEYTFTVENNRTLTANFGTHWTPIEGNQTTATVKGVVSINGVQQVNPNNVLEVGAFCGDECRAVTKPQFFPPSSEYVAQMSVRSNVLSGETITFRLYNYETMEEYDICPNTINYVAEAVYGNMGDWFQFAFYTELDITTSVNPENSGMLTGAGTYLYGSTATLTVTPNEGYEFVNWTKGGEVVSTETSFEITVIEAAEYVANFNIIISATANPAAGGTVTGAGSYAYGSTCELVATQNSGYEFVNWTKGGVEVSTNPTFSFTVEEPGVYVANFNPIEFEITAIANPTEGGTITGAGMYMVGTTCTLVATANPGYEFVNWTKNAVEVSTDASYSFTVENAATYYANFTGKQTTELVNGWNWWSTAIETNNNSLTVLEESLGHNGKTIKSQNQATDNYYQSLGYDYWWGDLLEINNESNYLIQTTTACNVVMTGDYANPAEHPITLVPNWTWIGYPVNAIQEVADAISNTFVPTDGDMIKSQGASITYYDGYGWWTSEEIKMIPGKGYKYQSNASDNKTLTFVNGGIGSKSDNTDNHYWKSNPHAYADNMVIFATAFVENEEQHNADLELGAFVDGVCRGRTHMKYFEPLGRYIALMTVSGEKGEEIEFGLVNASSNLISLDCSDRVVFESDAVVGSLDNPFEVHFSEMQEFSRSKLQMFPNPVNRNETVSFNLPDDEDVKEVIVTNAVGAVVRHIGNSLNMISEGLPMSGIYMVKVVCNSGHVYIGKLIVK